MEAKIEAIIPEVAELSDVFADLVRGENIQMQLLNSYLELAHVVGGDIMHQVAEAVEAATRKEYEALRNERVTKALDLMDKIDEAHIVLFALADRTVTAIIDVAAEVADPDVAKVQTTMLAVWAAYTHVMQPYTDNQIDATGVCPFCGGDATDEDHNDTVVIAGLQKEEGEDANA